MGFPYLQYSKKFQLEGVKLTGRSAGSWYGGEVAFSSRVDEFRGRAVLAVGEDEIGSERRKLGSMEFVDCAAELAVAATAIDM